MEDLKLQIDKAFDYRGDVTLTLKDGSTVVGFMSNREPRGVARCREPFVEMMIDGRPDKMLVKYSEISKVELTGEDTAAGKSWDEWIIKEEARKKSQVVGK